MGCANPKKYLCSVSFVVISYLLGVGGRQKIGEERHISFGDVSMHVKSALVCISR